VNFIIVAAARTGSTHLSNYLSRHREIFCHGESFHPQRVHFRGSGGTANPAGRQHLEKELEDLRAQDPHAFLERIFRLDNGREHVGFKIFGNHNPKMLRSMLKNDSIRNVVLFRGNVLARYASVMAAKQTETWGANPKRPLVTFNPDRFGKHAETYLTFFEETLGFLNRKKLPYFFIRSDELNNEARLVQLLNFIGATPVLPEGEPADRVRGSSDIVSRFSNPDDVSRYLEDNGLMHWAYEGDLHFALRPDGDASSPPLDQK
jgi:hypothetical protein